MYCKYTYKPGSSFENIFNDIASVIAGQTDKTLLSSACNVEDSEIVSTIPSGWTAEPNCLYGAIEYPSSSMGSAYATYPSVLEYAPQLNMYLGCYSNGSTINFTTSTDGLNWVTKLNMPSIAGNLVSSIIWTGLSFVL